MKKTIIYGVVAIAGLLGIGCSHKSNPAASAGTRFGSADAVVIVGPVGSLAKTEAIDLSKGYLRLSAAGETTRLDSFTLSGNAQADHEKIFSDLKVKSWQAKAWTVDVKGTVIHSDSVNFTVLENDTVAVTLTLAAKYSQMSGQIYPISDSASECVVWVNGSKVIDTAFGKNSSIDTLKLSYDYLAASVAPGTPDTVVMNVFGDWIDRDTLLWTGHGIVSVVSGVDTSVTIPLAWVGPKIGGADVDLVFGKIGTVTVNGEVQPRPNSGSGQ